MRLLIVGSLNGQIGHATKIAMERGAKVSHAGSIEQALDSLRGGAGADLVFCDVTMEIGTLVRGLAAERICTPVVACGVGSDTRRAVDAIRAGAKEYLPLPADAELIIDTSVMSRQEAVDAVLGLLTDGCKVGVQLKPDPKAAAGVLDAAGSDREFASSDPEIRAAKPIVGEIIVAY